MIDWEKFMIFIAGFCAFLVFLGVRQLLEILEARVERNKLLKEIKKQVDEIEKLARQNKVGGK